MFSFKNLLFTLGMIAILFTGCNEKPSTGSAPSQPDTNKAQTESNTNHTGDVEEKNTQHASDSSTEPSKEIVRYQFEEGNQNEYILPLYAINYVKGDLIMTNVVEDYAKIKKGTSILETAKIVAAHVSKQMSGLRLGVEIEEMQNGVKCLNIELIEHDTKDEFLRQSWAQAFAASTAATETLTIIAFKKITKVHG